MLPGHCYNTVLYNHGQIISKSTKWISCSYFFFRDHFVALHSTAFYIKNHPNQANVISNLDSNFSSSMTSPDFKQFKLKERQEKTFIINRHQSGSGFFEGKILVSFRLKFLSSANEVRIFTPTFLPAFKLSTNFYNLAKTMVCRIWWLFCLTTICINSSQVVIYGFEKN